MVRAHGALRNEIATGRGLLAAVELGIVDRLTEIFSDIVTRADAQASTRCPYRNRHDVCTAQFRCRNQAAAEDDSDDLICTHDGVFDYRSAWESDPRAADTARRRIKRQRRRPEADPPPPS